MNVPFYHREAAAKVRDLSAQFPCVLVTGTRQVGKSTMLRAMMPEGMRYPALHEDPTRKLHDYFSSYLQTYIQRDVQDLLHIADHTAFHRFIQSAAARSGQQLVYADLARDADVSPNTAKSRVSVLEASGIISLLPPYYINTSNLQLQLFKKSPPFSIP